MQLRELPEATPEELTFLLEYMTLRAEKLSARSKELSDAIGGDISLAQYSAVTWQRDFYRQMFLEATQELVTLKHSVQELQEYIKELKEREIDGEESRGWSESDGN